jgi:hypothetical protein
MLNAVELWVERPVNDDQYVGFVVNPLLGQTANFIHSTGFFDDPTDGEEVDLVQAYIQVYIPWSKGFRNDGERRQVRYERRRGSDLRAAQ